MQISLRSQLIAGAAAVVGASAIAINPVTQANLALPDVQVPSGAQVALTAFTNPLSEIFQSLGQANTFVFGSGDTAADYLPFIFNAAGLAIIQTGFNFNAVGIVPQIINDGLPILTQVATNKAAYLDSSLNAVYSIGNTLSNGVWNAAGELLTLDIPAALNTLLTSVEDAGMTALQAGNYVLENSVARASALLSAVPTLANLVVNSAIGQAQVLAGSVVQYANAVVSAIQTGDLETIWNTTVEGLLGPTGLPGVVHALTIGAGVQVDAATVVPSVRGVIQATVQGVADALATTTGATPVPPPSASVPVASAAASVPAASASAASVGSSPAASVGSSPASAPSAASVRAAAAEDTTAASEESSSAASTAATSTSAKPGSSKSSAKKSSTSSSKSAKRSVGGSKRAAHKAS